MRNFQVTLETRKRSFISASSICMTVPLSMSFDFNAAYGFHAFQVQQR